MNRYFRRGSLVMIPCFAVVGYVMWAEIAKQKNLEALRNRQATPRPAVEPLENEPAEEEEVELTAEQILDLATQRWETIDDYHCTTVVFLRRGDETDEKVLDVVFKRPSLYRNTVIEGDNQGAVVTLNAEGVIHGKHGGALSLIVLTLESDDERLRGLRGRRFFETAWGIEIQELRDAVAAGWQLTRGSDEDLDGSPCYVVVGSGEAAESDMTNRQFWFDQQTHLLRRLIDSADDVLVRDAKFINVELNANPEGETFRLK